MVPQDEGEDAPRRFALTSELGLADDLLPHIGNFTRARRPGAVAMLCSRTMRAAWTNDASGTRQGILDPGNVQYLGRSLDRLGGGFGNSRFAVMMQAFIGDTRDDVFRIDTVRTQRRHQIDPYRQHMG